MYQNNTLRFSNCNPVPMSDLPAVNEQLRKELLFFEATAEKPGTAGAILRIMRDAHLTVGKLIEGIMLTCDDIDQLIEPHSPTRRSALQCKNSHRIVRSLLRRARCKQH